MPDWPKKGNVNNIGMMCPVYVAFKEQIKVTRDHFQNSGRQHCIFIVPDQDNMLTNGTTAWATECAIINYDSCFSSINLMTVKHPLLP